MNDNTTLCFWMWSFKLCKAVKLRDFVFFDHLLPFQDPSVLERTGNLTKTDIATMHLAHGALEDDDVFDLPSAVVAQDGVNASVSSGDRVSRAADDDTGALEDANVNVVAADVDADNVLHHKRDRRPRPPLPISMPPPPRPLITSPMQQPRKVVP